MPAKKKDRFVPSRLVGQIYGVWIHADGRIGEERPVGSIEIPHVDFEKLPEMVAEQWSHVQAHATEAREETA